MRVEGRGDNAFLMQMKEQVNKAVEVFVDAAKEAEERMSFRAFTLGNMDIEAQYRLSDVIFTQTAIHLQEYTPHSLEKYTYGTSVTTEKDEADDEHLVLWYHFTREKPAPPEKIELTAADINPYRKPEEVLPPIIEEPTITLANDTMIVAPSGIGHVEPEAHIRCGATYDA
jgi:hypothetical protein